MPGCGGGLPRRRGKRNATGVPPRRQRSSMSDRPLRVDPAERLGAALARRRPGAPRQGRRPSMSGRRRRLSRSLLRLVVLLLSCGRRSSAAACSAISPSPCPTPASSTRAERRPSVTILAADGSLLTTYGDLFGQPLTLKEMSPYLPKAVDRDRGSPLLQPFRGRSDRARSRRLRQSPRRPCRPGRQHDHPAARQEPVPDARAQPRPQDPGDAAGAVARAPLHEEPDPRDLSQPRLSRRRHLWRRCRGAPLFQQIGAANEPLRERRHRRPAEGADPVQPDPRPRQGRGADRAGPRQNGRGRLCHQQSGDGRRCSGGASLAAVRRDAAGRSLFRRLGGRADSAILPTPAIVT